jgi:hypothetical protein
MFPFCVKIFSHSYHEFIQQRTLEADSCLVDQEIPRRLWNPNVHYKIYSNLPIDAILPRDGVTIDGVCIGNWIYWTLKQLVTTNNYDSLTELHTPKITVTTAHIKSSQSSVAVAY